MLVPTSLQQETWVRSLAAGGRLRAMPALVQVEGELDLTRYRAALAALQDAHDSLRMTFRADEPLSARVVPGPREEPEVSYLDARDTPSVWEAARDLLTTPFPLEGNRRIRSFVVRTGADTHMLGLAADHLAMDGLSLVLLARDLLARYNAAGAHSATQSPATPTSYADFARRQRELLAGNWGARRKAYWYHHFDRWGSSQPGSPLAVRLPDGTDWLSGQTMVLRAMLGEPVAQALDGAARAHASTRFGVLAAALSREQLRMSDRSTAGVVTDFHGRVLPSTWTTLGLFSHGLNLFLDRAEADDFGSAVRALTERVEGARSHAVPVRPLAKSWLAERGQDVGYGEPNFIYLGVRPQPARYLPTGDGGGLRASPVDVGQLINHALGSLTLLLTGSAQNLVLEGRFNAMLFRAPDVEAFVRAALAAIGPSDVEITTTPRTEARMPSAHRLPASGAVR
jgi:hypothetical protein